MRRPVIAVALLVPSILVAQTNSPVKSDTTTSHNAVEVEQPAGLRAVAAAHGFSFRLGLTNDVSSIAAGGVQKGSATRALFNGVAEVDLQPLVGWRGASVLLGWAAQRGRNGSEFAGDAQAFSNIDTDPFSHLYESWFQQAFGEVARVKVGRVDANTEFAVVDAAGSFINASAGFSPTVTGLPTYPDPQLSVNAFVSPFSWLTLSGGLFRGTFDDVERIDGIVKDRFGIAQLTTSWKGGQAHVGRWLHTGLGVRFDGEFESRPSGWYTAIEQRVSGHDESDDAPAAGIRAFAKYGSAPAAVATFQQHVMGGVVFDGGLRRRSQDALGFAFTHVDLSNDPAAGFAADETSFESFYRLPVLGQVALRPDVQYIVHPSGDRSVRNAFVFTFRLDLSY